LGKEGTNNKNLGEPGMGVGVSAKRKKGQVSRRERGKGKTKNHGNSPRQQTRRTIVKKELKTAPGTGTQKKLWDKKKGLQAKLETYIDGAQKTGSGKSKS